VGATAGTHLGWYLDLPAGGERSITPALARDDKIIFSTFIPATTPCDPSADGWLMELDALSGGRLADTLDTNDDGFVDAGDRINLGGTPTAVSGMRTGGGSGVIVLSSNPALANPPRSPGECLEAKYATKTDGSRVRIQEKCKPAQRESWFQPR
jgi:type IV pilus assembly protein PilY1